ncbi:MAG: LamG domain-containing protein [Opitutaceae bacterium]|jgi:hypothetical protein|nr:LamG domain-containing protein [Opitutaceae bacterium]
MTTRPSIIKTLPAALCALLAVSFPGLRSPATAATAGEPPAPALRYAPAAPGHTLPNLGTGAGLAGRPDAQLLLRKNTAKNFGNCEPATLVLDTGTGPFQRGRAIDLSANDGNGGKVIHCASIARTNLGGLPACTITLWYKLAAPLPTARGSFTTLFRSAAFDLLFSTDTLCALARGTEKADGAPDRLYAPRDSASALAREGEWLFVALVWDGATGDATLLGGSESARAAVLKTARLAAHGTAIPDKGLLNLGYHNLSEGGTRAFDGQLADIRVYAAALAPAQVETVRVSAGK